MRTVNWPVADVEDGLVEVYTVCPMCRKANPVRVSARDYWAWSNGRALIQNAMPYLSDDKREMLMTGLCGECYKKMWEFFEDDEQDESESDVV